MNPSTSVEQPAAKIVSVWVAWLASVGISSWTDVAALLAALYSLILVCEWVWRRCVRGFCERRGWVKRRLKRAEDKYITGD